MIFKILKHGNSVNNYNSLFLPKDAEEEHNALKSYNIKFTSYNDANEVGDELFESFRSRYQGNLETSLRESDFIF